MSETGPDHFKTFKVECRVGEKIIGTGIGHSKKKSSQNAAENAYEILTKERNKMGKVAGMVALVGRPNVGKSTLFNLMTRSKNAIVDDMPGVTRDRLYGICSFEDENGFTVIDTGGLKR